ncbi:MAG: ATP-dependent DNA helicase RecG, partial [Burkholderiales bacterium]|nr:ATP-dependent DNA helicase RecG [Burkholderiales bacterium]
MFFGALPGARCHRRGQPAARRAGRGGCGAGPALRAGGARANRGAPRRKPAAKPGAAPGVKGKAPAGALQTSLTGVAPGIASKLAKLGIRRDFDLVLHLPLRYEDETRITPIAALVDGVFAQVEGVVTSAEIAYRPRRTLLVRVADATGILVLRFLNFYTSQVKALAEGRRLRVCGESRSGFFGAEMIHPRWREVAEGAPLPAALTPVYPATAGVGQLTLRRVVVAAVERARTAGQLDDTAPSAEGIELPGFAAALMALHFPAPGADLSRETLPWRRMKFDELLAQQLSLKRSYRARRIQAAAALAAPGNAGLEARLMAALPFRLTAAQERVARQILNDLTLPHPMRRLLQGDVGSGKTIVAALAACRAIDCGRQAAFMAPTEILAEQHFRKLDHWLTPLGVKIAWLSGGRDRRSRNAALEQLATGEAHLAVGTHALFQAGVEFKALGLAIVDEQHRFGVEQRLSLAMKGGAAGALAPHQLMMSATPIPRTLAMTFYADLDVSVIDELPPGRTPVATRLVAESRRDEIIARIREACRAGRQVYWVCPLIEESEL